MVAVTYGVARVAGAAAAETKVGKTSKGLFWRVLDMIAASQLKRAEREIARHSYLLPANFDLNRDLWSSTSDKSPRGGW